GCSYTIVTGCACFRSIAFAVDAIVFTIPHTSHSPGLPNSPVGHPSARLSLGLCPGTWLACNRAWWASADATARRDRVAAVGRTFRNTTASADAGSSPCRWTRNIGPDTLLPGNAP